MQRAATTQSEAERLLAGARDLEESIGVSLSARRFEVRNAPSPTAHRRNSSEVGDITWFGSTSQTSVA